MSDDDPTHAERSAAVAASGCVVVQQLHYHADGSVTVRGWMVPRELADEVLSLFGDASETAVIPPALAEELDDGAAGVIRLPTEPAPWP